VPVHPDGQSQIELGRQNPPFWQWPLPHGLTAISQWAMETELGISIIKVGYSPCTSSTCNSGECLNQIEVGNSVNVVDSDHLIVSSPDLFVSYHCQYVNGHSHLKLPTRFLHIPLTQGFGEQRLEPFSHNFPVKPSLQ
jgi:hypothetical protein